ncbi:MAG: hypothetical protein ABI440_11140 [Casimicrobiaceae bacterium]
MLNPSDAVAIEERLRAIERRTGVQIVVAIATRTSRFHGLRWRAFAMGAALSALVVVMADIARPDWITAYTASVTAIAILGAALSCAAVATAWPRFERLFLAFPRAEAAVHQRAQALFLERELFATPRRDAILLLLGRFERAMAVIGDVGFRGKIDRVGWHQVIDAATGGLARGDARAALIAGLDALDVMLPALADGTPSQEDGQLPDALLDIGDAT